MRDSGTLQASQLALLRSYFSKDRKKIEVTERFHANMQCNLRITKRSDESNKKMYVYSVFG